MHEKLCLLLIVSIAICSVFFFKLKKSRITCSLVSDSASLSSEEFGLKDHNHIPLLHAMQEDSNTMSIATTTALSNAKSLIPTALDKARATTGFILRWKSIISKLEQVLPRLSDLSSHPCFSKNALCLELLQSITTTLSESIQLAEKCNETCNIGKLQMQSDLDVLSGKLDLNLHDCALLMKTGALGESTPVATTSNTRELLTRLQIGHADAKHKAVDELLEQIRENEKSVFAVLGRANISAIVQLLASADPKTKEKAVCIICYLEDSGSFENLLISEGVLPALIRLAESGTAAGREKAVISLQKLSLSPDTARTIVGHGGARPLIEICRTNDSASQSAAAGTLKNLSAAPEVRQILYEEGVVKVLVTLLEHGVAGSKEHAAECLQNLTAGNENLRRCVVSEGGIKSLLLYLQGPSPQEPGVVALRNLAGSVSVDSLLSLGVVSSLRHVLKEGSVGAQQAAASIVCKISCSSEAKRLVGEMGCVPPLVGLLEAKSGAAREAGAKAMACLMMNCPRNCREVKKAEKSVAGLVLLLDPGLSDVGKKYAVSCLSMMASSRRCRKGMVAHGAVGYLKKLVDLDVPGAKKLVERLERGKLRSLFSRK